MRAGLLSKPRRLGILGLALAAVSYIWIQYQSSPDPLVPADAPAPTLEKSAPPTFLAAPTTLDNSAEARPARPEPVTLEQAKEEATANPHSMPPSMRALARSLTPLMDRARKDARQAPAVATEVVLLLDASSYPPAKAFLLRQLRELSGINPELATELADVEHRLPEDVVRLSKL